MTRPHFATLEAVKKLVKRRAANQMQVAGDLDWATPLGRFLRPVN